MTNQDEFLTAIGDALATACARIRAAETASRIVVLLSDGESNTGIIDPETATTLASELGIKVYTIGVGTTGEAPFRVRDVYGRERIRWAEVAMDEPLLRHIAQETGGRYFNVQDPDGLEDALTVIDELETTRVEREEYEQYNELFPRFLLPALLLVAIGSGLNMTIAKRIV